MAKILIVYHSQSGNTEKLVSPPLLAENAPRKADLERARRMGEKLARGFKNGGLKNGFLVKEAA